MVNKKLIRTSVVSVSLNYLLKGQLAFLQQQYEIPAVSWTDTHLRQVAHREKVQTFGNSIQKNKRNSHQLHMTNKNQ